ncbi:chemotaxis methyltransferase CheR [Chromobacterium violaceum]|uniref:Chemotaxis methyltransferase CheR n=1 Tax=Chromobacterium violaceum TaxID=536 RepID=A0A447TE80_CHRVL|nr:chemotaxis methyltransferase CheR [Chromobacterium violaceum]
MHSSDPVLNDAEFARFRQFILSEAGIDLPASKRSLVQSRLSKRLRHLGWTAIPLTGNCCRIRWVMPSGSAR